jgi:hypothetical protein
LRPHDLRHHAVTKLAESSEASEQTTMSIAEHVSREMLEHYSRIRQEAKRKAVESLDNVPITSQLAKWEAAAKPSTELKKQRNKGDTLVGTGRFELPTPRTPSECSTRLSHVPTRKNSTDAQSYHEATRQAPTEGFTPRFYTTTAILDSFGQ